MQEWCQVSEEPGLGAGEYGRTEQVKWKSAKRKRSAQCADSLRGDFDLFRVPPSELVAYRILITTRVFGATQAVLKDLDRKPLARRRFEPQLFKKAWHDREGENGFDPAAFGLIH